MNGIKIHSNSEIGQDIDGLMKCLEELEDGTIIMDIHSKLSGIMVYEGFMCHKESNRIFFSDECEHNWNFDCEDVEWYLDEISENIVIDMGDNINIEMYRM